MAGFTDDNKEWLKPVESKKKKSGKKSVLPLDEDSNISDDSDEMVSCLAVEGWSHKPSPNSFVARICVQDRFTKVRAGQALDRKRM